MHGTTKLKIEMELTEVRGERVSWIDAKQNNGKWRAVVRTVMNNCVP
jgi:hypothetical protein